jgi:hypothetical protein
MLKKKLPYIKIVTFLQDKGIKLSKTSVYRHNNNHRLAKSAPKEKPTSNNNDKPKKYAKHHEKKRRAKQNSNSGDYETTEKRNMMAVERDMQAINKRKKKVLKNVARMEEDFNVLDKMTLAMQIAEDRLFRAVEEEIDTKMVIPVTSHAMKDYINACKTYAEASAGMSKTEFNFAQMVNVVGDIFSLPQLSDKAKNEILTVVDEFGLKPEEELIEVEVVQLKKEEQKKGKG